MAKVLGPESVCWSVYSWKPDSDANLKYCKSGVSNHRLKETTGSG